METDLSRKLRRQFVLVRCNVKIRTPKGCDEVCESHTLKSVIFVHHQSLNGHLVQKNKIDSKLHDFKLLQPVCRNQKRYLQVYIN